MDTTPEPCGLKVVVIPGEAAADSIVVQVVGEIDLLSAPALQDALDLAHEPGRSMVVDLAGVSFMDSSGVSALVMAANRVTSEKGAFSLVNPQSNIRRVLDLLGLTKHLGLTDEGRASLGEQKD